MVRIHRHFSEVAQQYKKLRTTDLELIFYIQEQLQDLQRIYAADVGCGCGRYVTRLFQYLGDKLYLDCIDTNKEMLEQLQKSLQKYKIDNFQIRQTFAKNLPIQDEFLDCIFTFNAIHHFSIFEFLNEVSRVLKDGGYFFIYTRLRSQNRTNIWGQYFPLFHQKEIRLYELDELKYIVEQIPKLEIQDIKLFNYERVSSLDRLVEQARNHHYSTFYLYSDDEFEESLNKFQQNLKRHFKDLDAISWFDENVLFVVRKRTFEIMDIFKNVSFN